jgi:hypothetical protein
MARATKQHPINRPKSAVPPPTQEQASLEAYLELATDLAEYLTELLAHARSSVNVERSTRRAALAAQIEACQEKAEAEVITIRTLRLLAIAARCGGLARVEQLHAVQGLAEDLVGFVAALEARGYRLLGIGVSDGWIAEDLGTRQQLQAPTRNALLLAVEARASQSAEVANG